MAKDYYKILNVSRDAKEDEIKKSYRKLARKYHPDLNPNNKGAEAKFVEISEAYETLSNKEKRQIYDAGGFEPKAQGFGQGPFYSQTQAGDSSRYRDIFNETFGGINFEELFKEQAQRQKNQSFRGEDHVFQMEIDFKDAILGAEKIFSLPNGNKISAKIPAGIRTSQKIKLTGRGGPGYNGGANGDLYIEIHVRPSSQFRRVGNNIEIDVPVLFSKAMLEDKIQVPTIDGSVEVNLPHGVSTGTKLRIKGKGVQNAKGPGDLFAVIKISMPKEVSIELKEAVKKWQETVDNKTGEEING
jgi:DnaJ-class molecular chaperone